MKYHISKTTGRVNICRADVRACPIGGEHFTTKEEAKKASEKALEVSYGSLKSLQKPLKSTLFETQPVDPSLLSAKEMKLLWRRLRGGFLLKELKSMVITANTPAFVSFNRNGEAAFDYNNYETQKLFTKGACGFLAYALHEKTGLPITIVTADPKTPYWQGHVALKLGEDRYLDVTGVCTMDEFVQRYELEKAKFTVEDITTPKDFMKAMGVADDKDIYANLGDFEKAILERISRDLARDYIG